MRVAMLMLGLALCTGAAAQDGEPPMVQVDGMKNPQMRSYRAVSAGLDMFDKQHDLAPAAPEVRFRILGRNGQPVQERTLALRIASDDQSAPVAIAGDNSFSVPRLEWAYDQKADLMFNWKENAYRIETDVHTPGLPDNVRRLGDLRLECEVQVAIAKEEMPFFLVALVNSLLLTTDWCMKDKFNGEQFKFGYLSPKPLLSASLVFGERSQKLDIKKLRYQVPLGDRSWPDDALVQLEYAPEASVAEQAPAALAKQ